VKIGIGLPASIPGTTGNVILEWARRADTGPFSSLGITDRLVYPNYEPMIALAGAAGTTKRIRLITTALLAPLRNTAILAKQAASLDALSGGRLTLGLSIGAREDNFQAAGVPFTGRGKRFEEQLTTMKRIWAGEPVAEGLGSIGPVPARPGGPELLIGGYAPQAIERAARYADGFIAGRAGPPEQARQAYDLSARAWKAAGHEGKPRFVCCAYVGLGNAARAGEYIRDYYSFLGPEVKSFASAVPNTPEKIRDTLRAFDAIGADELILWPTIAELDQVDRLAELVV
jgi:alkanesulfonate monooxygenase SsuD/methylene tetrahydromethanopterin reductase-like flavin-dependent oxidoreductase (luciferase family)